MPVVKTDPDKWVVQVTADNAIGVTLPYAYDYEPFCKPGAGQASWLFSLTRILPT